MMFYRHGTSVRDIAAALELSEDTVKQRLSRGRSQLKTAVGRQVDRALETIRVREHFGIAVLAAIPIAVTAPEIFAATSAASTAGAAAKSSGGIPLLASFGSWCMSLAYATFFPLVMLFGVFSGAWNCVTNSPTLRSRRWMCQTVLFHCMVYFTSMSLLNFCSIIYRYLSFISLTERQASIYVSIFVNLSNAYMFLIPVYCVATAIVVNRKWRRIVQEDMQGNIHPSTKPTADSVRRFMKWCIAIPLLAMLPFVGFVLYLSAARGMWVLGDVLEDGLSRLYFYRLMVIVLMIAFYYTVRLRFQDEESLVTYPPRIGNYLAVLSGEEKPRTGYRLRVCFWGDIVTMGFILCILQGFICTDSLANIRSASDIETPLGLGLASLFALVFAGYLVFAIFFAGIPRRRYWGFIFLAVWLGLLNLPYYFIIEPWLLHYDVTMRRVFQYMPLLICEYITCLAAVGIAGLLVFRRKSETQS
jgi:hypothetical protein